VTLEPLQGGLTNIYHGADGAEDVVREATTIPAHHVSRDAKQRASRRRMNRAL